MITKINSTIFILILSLWLCSITWAAGGCQTGFSSPGTCYVTSDGTTPSCAVADVQAAVNAALDGDIVVLPACAGTTWNSYLTITKGITLQGAGIDNTIIKGDTYGGYYGIINIRPAANQLTRITGFTLDGDSKSNCIWMTNNTARKIDQLRIDHNKFINTTITAVYSTSAYIYGLVDNNIFDLPVGDHVIDVGGTGSGMWDTEIATRSYGTANSWYIEDNTITCNNFLATSGQGGSYVFRYNTSTHEPTNFFSPFDAHGNQGVKYSNFSTMTVEIYGNEIANTNANGGKFGDFRGGWILLFDNMVTNSNAGTYYYIREEYADDYKGSAYEMKVTNSYFWGNFLDSNLVLLRPDFGSVTANENCCVHTEDWQASHNYGSYYCSKWNSDSNGNCWRTIDNWTPSTRGPSGSVEPNWAGSPNKMDVVIDGQVTWLNMGTGTPVFENTDFFIQKTGTFDGTGVTGGGVG